MKIVAEMPEYLVKGIRGLVGSGQYSSMSSFICVSAENQLALEAESGSDLLESMDSPAKAEVGVSEVDYSNLLLPEGKELDFTDGPEKSVLEIYSKKNDQEDWLWGQINRLFPVKCALRILLNIQIRNGRRVEYEKFCTEASHLARSYGLRLLALDKEAGRKRDERLSVGFPIGEKKDKAIARFSTQFIGLIRKDGRLSGALPSLRFANIICDDRGCHVGITEQGFDFAILANPTIDNNSVGRVFTEEERSQYLKHIKEHVVGEHEAFNIILNNIQNGVREREELNKALNDLALTHNWTENMINTQRAGAMSRLYEFGLISKIKQGIHVKYDITDAGKDFISLGEDC